MKKKLLGILAVSAALMITACNAPAGNNSGKSGEPTSQDPAPSSEKKDARVAVASVKLDRNNVSLKPEAYTRLIPTIAPANATNKEVLWSSSNPGIASVDQKGTVTAHNKGTATITVKTFDGNFKDTCTVTVENKHAIQAKADNNVRILVADKGEEDSVVDVKLSYNKEKYAIEGVYANGVKCGTKNSDFYFIMPATPVTLEARYHEIPAKAVYKDVFTNSEGVSLKNIIGGRAEVGTKVEFQVFLTPGLDFTGVISAKANGADVPLTNEGGATYSFTMPNYDVEVEVETKAQLIPFDLYGETAQDVIGSIKVNGESWYKSYIPYGAAVEITTLSPRAGLYDTYLVEEFALCDQAAIYFGERYASYGITPDFFAENFAEAEDDGYTFRFNMPAVETWLYAVETPRYVDVEVTCPDVLEYVPLELYNDRYYLMDETQVVYNGTQYFGFNNIEGYAPRKVYVERYQYFNNYFGSSSKSTSSREELLPDANGVYSLKVKYRPAETIQITVLAKDEAELENSPLAGDYYGVYTWGYNKDETLTSFTASNNNLNIGVDGDMNVGGSAYAYLDYEEFDQIGVMYDPTSADFKYAYFAYNNGVFYTQKNTGLFNDVYKYIYFQKDAADEGSEAYKLVYENLDSGKVFIAKFYRDGVLYNSAFVNYNTEEFYAGVTFNMIEGEEITDAKAVYQVKYGAKVVATVSYKGTGGAANRGVVAANALFGSFKHDLGTLGTLVADGLGGLTFGGAAATISEYNPANGELVFSDANGDIYKVRVNVVLGTYTLLEKKESPATALIGKAFLADDVYYNNYSHTMVKDAATYKVEFLAGGEAKVTITVDGHDYSADQASKKGKYTVNGFEVTVEFYATNSSSKTTWKFTVNDALTTLTPATNNNCCYFEIGTADWYFVPTQVLNLL